MPNVNWKSLEGKPWKLDVGSTMNEALQSKDNSTLHLTTDGQIVMNGVAFCNSSYYATLQYPDKLFSLSKYSEQDEILNAFTLYIDGQGEKTMTTDEITDLLESMYMYGFKVVVNNEQFNFLQIALEDIKKGLTINLFIEKYMNGNIYRSLVRITAGPDDNGDTKLHVLSSYKNRKIRETKISEPDFKVCVRKAIPLHPRKGMKYFFDDGIIKFKITKKDLGSYNYITIPNDGNEYYLYHSMLETKVLQGGTVISGANYEQYKDYFKGDTLIISRETSSPKLVTITRERKKDFFDNCFSDGYIKVIGKPTSEFNFEGRRKYTKVVNSKYFYALPVPELKAGSDPYSGENKRIYAVFRLKKKRFRYYGKNEDGKVLVDDKKNVLSSPSKRKTGYRICRTYTKHKGVVYICRYKKKSSTGNDSNLHHRIEYGPLVRYFIGKNYKIKKRI